MNKRIKINVIIANRHYPMSIAQHEEPSIRKAVKEIEKKIKEIESKYDIQDKQDALSMCLLQYASKIYIEALNEESKEKQIEDRIEDIINDIDKVLLE